jgi:hypothetical protein
LSTGDNLYVNVEDNRLEFLFGPHAGSGGPYAAMAHLIKFEDLSPTAPTIGAISYQTNLAGFTRSNILFTGHSVTIGQGGIDYTGGQTLTVFLQFVPEPSSMLLAGPASLAASLIRRRKPVPPNRV